MGIVKSSKCVCLVDSARIAGKAEYTAQQIERMNSVRHSKLNRKSTYLVLAQWIHKEKLEKEFKGYTTSKKIFVVELVDNVAVRAFSMPVSQLLDRYLLEVLSDVKPQIPAIMEKRNGKDVWTYQRDFSIDGVEVKSRSVIEEGYLPQKGSEGASYIERPVMFTIAEGGHYVWKAESATKDGEYSLVARDGKFLDLEDPSWVYKYFVTPCSPNEDYGKLSDYFAEIEGIDEYMYEG